MMMMTSAKAQVVYSTSIYKCRPVYKLPILRGGPLILMFIQRFNKRVAWCVSYGHKDFFLSLFPLLSLYPTFFLWYRLSYTKTICQNALTKKKEKGQVTRKFFYWKLLRITRRLMVSLSLSFLCIYRFNWTFLRTLCVCVYNCGSKADGMRIHQLAALHCVVLVWNVFFLFSFLSWKFWFFIITASSNSREMPPSHLNSSSSRFRPEHDELEYYTVVGIR